jgi:hypothetical protein
MNHEHLTDKQIQEMLDARIYHSGPILPMHLGTCASCQKRLESFRRLYAGLAADPGFALPPAFADSVLAKIPVSRPLFWQRPVGKIFLTASVCAAAMTGLLIFIDMRPLASGTLQVLTTLKTAFLPLGSQVQRLLVRLDSSAKPFILGGLGLSIAALVDRLLQRQALRRGH